ncbi:MAG: hypothetical protein ABL901_14480 [Hyphomicrobiaceae bacterium]
MSDKRKQPNLTIKLASALIHMAVPQDDGSIGYLFSTEEREVMKEMTAAQINSLFEFDHGVHHAIDGSIHPTNLTPRLILQHRLKTAIDKRIIAKTKRLAVAHAEHVARRAVGGSLAEVVANLAPKPSRSSWSKGRKLQSRPFQKREGSHGK